MTALGARYWDGGETLADRLRGKLTAPVRLRHARRRLGGRWAKEDRCVPSRSIVVRGGCDLHPVDAGTAAGRSLLTSFVWPFDLDRHVRLASALAVAASHPLHIDQTAASDWLPEVLATAAPDTLPVVWHCITQLYGGADRTRGRRGRLESLRRRASAGRGQHGVRPEWSARCRARAAYAAVGS